MNNTIEQDYPALTDAQREKRARLELIPVSQHGTAPQNYEQLLDYAGHMSRAVGVVGPHLIGNVGACLAVMDIAKQFDMPMYAVARQTYLVNGRVAFMGQIIHAIINKHCPLKKKLTWRYEGEGQDLKIFIMGEFTDETEPRVWESPTLGQIRVKNSPLWLTNPKHQLVYFGVRAWQTIHWPEGLLSIHTDDEAALLPPMHVGADNAKNITPGQNLMERLAAARLGGDGFKDGHTAAQVNAMRNGDMEPGDEVPPKQLDEEGTETAPIAAPEEGAGAPVADGATKPAPAGKNAQAALPLAQDVGSEVFVSQVLSAFEGAASSNGVKEAFATFKKAGRDDLTADQELAVTKAKTAALRRFSKKEGIMPCGYV